MVPGVPFQPSLFDAAVTSFDASFSLLRRIALDETAWVDHAPAWVTGSDRLFGELLATRSWAQRSRRMYEGHVLEPRLTDYWTLASGERLEPDILEAMRRSLGARYGVVFETAGFNLYRDGSDSVAWHGDKIRTDIPDPIIPLVSLGEPRRFLLRPKGGGRSVSFMLGRGDLLVTGGATHRTWDHSVPKVARAGPRISVAFRYGLDPRAYGRLAAGGDDAPEPGQR